MRLALVVAMLAAFLAGTTDSARADVIFPEIPIDGWDTDGTVLAVKVVGDTVYLGGEFTEVRSPSQGQTMARSNLAAIDIPTGNILPFAADPNDRVRSIESDGSTVWVGGSFNNIGGEHRSNIAALDPITGALRQPFDVSTNGSVQGLALIGDRLYAGGYFTVIEGAIQERVASLDPVTGFPDPSFQARADSGVRDLAASADGRLFVGGTFLTIGGEDAPYLAELDTATGDVVGPGFDEMIAPMLDVDVSPDGAFVFAAVAGFQNRAAAWNTFDGERRWYHRAMGDTQAVSYYDGILYFGFHEGFDGDETVRMLAADAISGELQDFRPSINSFYGVWAIDAAASGLAVGGEFSIVSEVHTRGIAIFEGDGTPPDTSPPSKPANVTAVPASGGAVDLAWSASQDNRAVSHYRVYRNGVLVGASTQASFKDDSVEDGTQYSYVVRASDLAGNLSAGSNPVPVRTWSSLITAGDEWRHDDTAHSSSSWRQSSYNDGGWDVGDAELGFGDGDEATTLQQGEWTYYFRKEVVIPSGFEANAATLALIRDDGAVVYINGSEVLRTNMPSGAIEPDTRALATVSGSDESEWIEATFDPGLLVEGTNVVAVEVHQRSVGSSDVSFDFRLDADLVDQFFDSEPPSRPEGFTTETRTSTRIKLDWNASSDNVGVIGYLIYRGGVQVDSTTDITYLDKNLWPLTEYVYKVFAVDEAGNRSQRSVISRSTTNADKIKPKKPKNVTTSATTNTVTIDWDPAYDNVGVDHYVVKSAGALLGTTTDTIFTMSGLDPEVDYHISVRAVDVFGNRGPRVHRHQTTLPEIDTYYPLVAGSSWRYLDDGSDQGTAWAGASFDDGSWSFGNAQLGYGDGDEATVVDEGPVNDRHITTYFRSDFDIEAAGAVTELRLRLIRDDGAVVYINGVEAYRDNMPPGQIGFDTLATVNVTGSVEDEWVIVTVPHSALVTGSNVIAVEIHQKHRSSSDVSFDLSLTVNP